MNFKEYLKLNESDSHDENLKSIKELESLKPLILSKVQKVYDDWTQDDEGHDIEYGIGGICHDIADEIASVLNSHGIDSATVSATIGTQHVYAIGKFQEGVYEIDINPFLYETGAAYTWKKIPNVTFTNDDITFSKLDGDPNSFDNYTENF